MSGQGEQSSDSSLDEILSSIRRIISDDAERPAGSGNFQASHQGGDQAIPSSNGANGHAPALPQPAAIPPQYQPAPQDPPSYQPVQADAPPPREVLQNAIQPVEANAVDVEPRFGTARRSLLEGLAQFEREGQTPGEQPGHSSVPQPSIQAAPSAPIINGGAAARLEQPIVLPTEDAVTEPADAAAAPLNGSASGHTPDEADVMELSAPMVAADPGDGLLEEFHEAAPAETIEIPAPPAAAEAPVPEPVEVNGPAEPEIFVLPAAPEAPAPVAEEAPVATETGEPAQPPAAAENDLSASADRAASSADAVVAALATPITASLEAPGSTSLEQTVTSLLKPMLREWLDQNMPRLIEEALREDVDQGKTYQAPDA